MNKPPLEKALSLLEEAYSNIQRDLMVIDGKKYIPYRSVMQHIGGSISYLKEHQNEKAG